MTPAELLERLQRWRGWLKTAYNWTLLDEEAYAAVVARLKKEKEHEKNVKKLTDELFGRENQ